MAKLVKYNRLFAINFSLLASLAISGCAQQSFQTTGIEAKNIPINSDYSENAEILEFIAPYKNKIDTDMNTVLTHASVVYDKANGKWQTNIGDLFAVFVEEAGNPIYKARTGNEIDMCLLNHGGIRAIIPAGEVKMRNAFEVMPFENSLYVAELKGETIYKMVEYLLREQKPHPLHNIQIVVDQQTNQPKSIKIKGVEVEKDKIYHVATNDYLVNGGDYMVFFNDAVQKHDLNYKLRDITIDYFKKVDTLPVIKQSIFIFE
ncbi:5'-nucleotidase C-terminal domain-containing protein [Flavobacterium agricola]|uniref:5'-nucleotidase C-terminal domain-containing protein n=1 Tax=Flavobacterium agricola TaxID=2870839 RepID=A0ABY6M0T4_9FLAO|nr:5'-nucleotidase [Flavobacterium agricola]UYW02163.1 5'-nucleotidase C-terminal domain-containing protein [Flavobacterium agricola]